MSQEFGSSADGGASETPQSVKAKYESNEDTNTFTDAQKQKLDGLKNIEIASDISSFEDSFNAALIAAQPSKET